MKSAPDALPSIKPKRGRDRVVRLLAGAYLLFWIAAAIAPFDRFDWLLENLLVFVLVGLMVATYRRFRLSTLAYVSIFAFLVIHTLGAHYTYSEMPLGFLVSDAFGWARNHYDRFAHFAFGLLFVYPAREIILRTAAMGRFGAGSSAFVLVFALSSAYELVEWWVALVVSPDAALAYLGTQGDVFDAQKDTSLAVAGAGIALAAIALSPMLRRAHATMSSSRRTRL